MNIMVKLTTRTIATGSDTTSCSDPYLASLIHSLDTCPDAETPENRLANPVRRDLNGRAADRHNPPHAGEASMHALPWHPTGGAFTTK